jgi:hypothetical protein
MRTTSMAILVVLLLGGAASASAQSVTDIVDKHLAASGGRQALAALKSRKITGTVTLTSPIGDLSGDIEVTSQAPNKDRTLITLDLTALGAGKMTFDQRFDGTAGYVIDSLQGNRDITGTQLENMKNNVFPSTHLTTAERGVAVTLAGREKVGDREAFVLVLEPKTGSTVRQYIDAETYLLIRATGKAEVPQLGEIEQVVDFGDYRDVEGIKMPFQVKTANPVQTVSVTITKVEHNTEVDESIFSKPPN